MNGTEWTEPGQGATREQLEDAAIKTSGAGRFYMGNPTGQKGNPRLRARALEHVRSLTDNAGTNLRLTGHTLTADDLKRIAEAK